MYAALFRDPDIGIVGPVSNHVAPIQRVPHAEWPTLEQLDAYAARRQQEQAGSGFYAHKLVGFCMLFHTSLLERSWPLTSVFPGNYEDDDFSIRARIGGKRLWVAQDVFIHHEGQGTFIRTGSTTNARRWRMPKNSGPSGAPDYRRPRWIA
ncbi:hypothetical protein VQ056_06400 [Paenibacillus sp. JTLBN-2024]